MFVFFTAASSASLTTYRSGQPPPTYTARMTRFTLHTRLYPHTLRSTVSTFMPMYIFACIYDCELIYIYLLYIYPRVQSLYVDNATNSSFRGCTSKRVEANVCWESLETRVAFSFLSRGCCFLVRRVALGENWATASAFFPSLIQYFPHSLSPFRFFFSILRHVSTIFT